MWIDFDRDHSLGYGEGKTRDCDLIETWRSTHKRHRITLDEVVARDGQYLAESSPAAGSTTTIYGPTGVVLGHIAGATEAFSWDGSLAVQIAVNGSVSVVRWRDGTVLWSGPSDGGYWSALPEPGGQRIAVSVLDPERPQTGGFPFRNIYVVGPDGQAVKLLTDVM